VHISRLTVFSVLTFLLLPFSFFFALMGVLLLLLSVFNLQVLLPVFMLICFCIYMVTSNRFLQKIKQEQPITKGLRDWIRVNAYVSIFMSFLFLMNAVVILALPDTQLGSMLQPSLDLMGNMANGISVDKLIHQMKLFSIFLLLLSLLLLVHIFINFRLQKIHPHTIE